MYGIRIGMKVLCHSCAPDWPVRICLADRARWLGIGDYILLGRGEEQTAGREKDSILADVLEALIAALYRDGGLYAARVLVERLFDGAGGCTGVSCVGTRFEE